MFEVLTNRFEAVFSKLKGRGKLTASEVDAALHDIRIALIEADVNVDVVKSLTERIRQRTVGTELSKALNPGQQVVKIVLQELTTSLGGEPLNVTYASKPPTVILLAGLQGTGKTTNSAKLAQWCQKQGRKPLLVGADLQRPAAVEQLRTLGSQIQVPVFSKPTDPVEVAEEALAEAAQSGCDVVIVDTAGRLAIDNEMMAQVSEISAATKPHFTFLVVDAMTGQDAVTSAKAFHETLALDGVILTKLDGDARGGAALSVKEVVGKPIAFASTGEKLDDFEQFHPDRLASRILGMGDIETLIDKAENVFEAEEASKATARLIEGSFTFDDFLDTMQKVLQMGNLGSLLNMMPGIGKQLRNADIDEQRIGRIKGMIHSMTPQERATPEIIDASRRQRIAAGSGCQPNEVKTLIGQFKQMRTMMKTMIGGGPAGRFKKRGSRISKKTNENTAYQRRGRGRKLKGRKQGRKNRRGGRVTPKGTRPAQSIPTGSPLGLPGWE